MENCGFGWDERMIFWKENVGVKERRGDGFEWILMREGRADG